jgi:hypothetical protein
MSNEIVDVVICEICEEPYAEGDKKAEAPCCGKVVHTQCMIELVANNTGRWHDTICGCGQILFAHARNDFYNNREADNAAVAELFEERKKNPTYKEHFLALKKVCTERNKTTTSFTKYLKTKVLEYKAEINTSLNIIKTAKANHIDALKLSEEYKKYRSAVARYNFHYNRFMRLYGLNGSDMRALFGGMRRRRFYRWNSGLSFLTRPFRIRI